MENNLNRYKKILFVLLAIFFIFVVPIFGYVLFIPRFHIDNFLEYETISYQSIYEDKFDSICYGNIFSCHNVSIKKEGNIDSSKLGSYHIKYIFSYEDKTLIKEKEIKVVDNENPTIEFKDTKLSQCFEGYISNYEIYAFDNYDGEITSKVIKTRENNEIVFEVEDSSGNKTKVINKNNLKDNVTPVITLKGDSTLYINMNQVYEEQGAIAVDNCDGDITDKIKIEGVVDTSKAGEYKISYTVSDSMGNTTSLIRNVWVYPQNNYNVPDGKSIYLTFDDGPGPYTNELLDILKKYNVKATFFVTNQGLTRGYDGSITRAYQEGHTIGLHSNTHNYGYIYANVDNFFEDLYALQTKVKELTGHTSMIMRFPGGSSNTISKNYDGGNKIMSKLVHEVKLRGFRYFDWNVVSGDAGETTNTAVVISNVINSLGNNSSYVVLQHDIKKFSVDAVESIIQFGLSRGYVFRALNINSPKIEHRVYN